MKRAQLIHNPGAGDESHESDKLVSLIEANGFQCRYSSTQEDDWKSIEKDVDFLIAAGGDGTIRRITKELLNRKKLDKTWPIAVLPMGTANNIAKTLGLQGNPEQIIQAWHHWNIVKYDVGLIHHFKEASFFLESFGYGLFPYLMRHMKKESKEAEIATPEESLNTSLRWLYKFIDEFEPVRCTLNVDGTDHSGEYVLVEVMNSRSIGPNLFLAPQARPDDGLLEVVLVKKEDKEKLAEYVSNKLKETDKGKASLDSVRGKKIIISWGGNHVHVDDEEYRIEKKKELEIEINVGLLEFLVP